MPIAVSASIGFAMMCVGMFMAILDVQVVSTSLPTIQRALAIPPDQMSWVQTAYLVAEVIAIPLTGFLTRVEAEERKRHHFSHRFQNLGQNGLLPHDQRRALGPAGCDIGQDEGLDEAAVRNRTGMGDEIGFAKPPRRIIPVIEGPDRRAGADTHWFQSASTTQAVSTVSNFPQVPINRRRAHLKELFANGGVENQVNVMFHGRYQNRE